MRSRIALADKVDTRWIMLRKEPVAGSTSKNWSEQQALLSDAEVTPNVAEVVWCVTTYKAVRNTYLLPDVYVRTSSLGSDGDRVYVSSFGAKALRVHRCGDDHRYAHLGVSAGRKF